MSDRMAFCRCGWRGRSWLPLVLALADGYDHLGATTCIGPIRIGWCVTGRQP